MLLCCFPGFLSGCKMLEIDYHLPLLTAWGTLMCLVWDKQQNIPIWLGSDPMRSLLISTFSLSFFLSYLFLLFWEAERQKQTEIYSVVHSANVRISQGWTTVKPGTRNSIRISHMGGRNPSIWAITCFLPGSWKESRAGTQTQAFRNGMQRHAKWHLNCCTPAFSSHNN